MKFFKIEYHSTVPPSQRDLATGATKTQYRNLNCETPEQAIYFENLRLEQHKNDWRAITAEVVTTSPQVAPITNDSNL